MPPEPFSVGESLGGRRRGAWQGGRRWGRAGGCREGGCRRGRATAQGRRGGAGGQNQGVAAATTGTGGDAGREALMVDATVLFNCLMSFMTQVCVLVIFFMNCS